MPERANLSGNCEAQVVTYSSYWALPKLSFRDSIETALQEHEPCNA